MPGFHSRFKTPSANTVSRWIPRALFVLLLTAAPPSSWAWGPAGHRIVARIAQQHLTPRASQRLRYFLGKNFTLEDLANRPDEWRRERPETGPWHYINISPKATALNLKRDCPSGDCITIKIREKIAGARLTLRGKEKSIEAITFLIHLVADLHQPLHAGHGEDRGGNRIATLLDGSASNLHSVWDSALIARLGDESAVTERLLNSITPAKKEDWRRGRLSDWTWESHLVAVRVCYGALPAGSPKRLDGAYQQRALPVVEEQLAKAGVRLAAILQDVWP